MSGQYKNFIDHPEQYSSESISALIELFEKANLSELGFRAEVISSFLKLLNEHKDQRYKAKNWKSKVAINNFIHCLKYMPFK